MKMKLQWLKGKLRRGGGGGAYKNGMSNLTFSSPLPNFLFCFAAAEIEFKFEVLFDWRETTIGYLSLVKSN